MKTVKEPPPKSLLESWREQGLKIARKQRRRHLVDHDEILKTFGKRLRTLRSEAGLTMVEAGAKSGISDNTINRIEGGENAQLSSVIALVKLYGYRVELRLTPLDTAPPS